MGSIPDLDWDFSFSHGMYSIHIYLCGETVKCFFNYPKKFSFISLTQIRHFCEHQFAGGLIEIHSGAL